MPEKTPILMFCGCPMPAERVAKSDTVTRFVKFSVLAAGVLLLSGCLSIPVGISAQNRVLAERITARAYALTGKSDMRASPDDKTTLGYFLEVIESRYYRPVDSAFLADIALKELEEETSEILEVDQLLKQVRWVIVDELDQYSVFYDREGFQEFRQSLAGRFVGIGVWLFLHPLGVQIEPIPGEPAAGVGMQAGDVITQADAVEFEGLDLPSIVNTLRGRVGSNVTLRVVRGVASNQPEELMFSITRAEVHQSSVESRVEEGIGYVLISNFTENTDDLLRTVLFNFERQALEGYVLDLRHNPGGLLEEAVRVADYFLDEGTIVTLRKRRDSEVYRASTRRTLTSRPMVVLIDQETASSSEIVAIALSEHARAHLMGKMSYGKDKVQTVVALPDGTGLALTTAQHFSPEGHTLEAQGIQPDVVLSDDPSTVEDEVLAAAIAYLKALNRE